MAFRNLNIDMSQLRHIPVQQRAQLAKSPLASDIFGNLTPSEIASLFPKYYRDKLPQLDEMGKVVAGRTTRQQMSGGGRGGGGGGGWGGDGGAVGNNYVPPSVGDRIIAQAFPDSAAMSRNNMMAGLMKRGFTKAEAAAVVGNIHAESGGKTSIQDYKGSGHFGYMQWGGDRLRGMQNYAASIGKDWTDPEVQLDWIAMERSGESADPKYGGTNEKAFYERAFASGDPAQMGSDFGRYVERPSESELASSENKRVNETLKAFDADIPTPTTALSDTGEVTMLPGQGVGETANVAPVPFDVSKLSPQLKVEYDNTPDWKKPRLAEAITKLGYEESNRIADTPSTSLAGPLIEGAAEGIGTVEQQQSGIRNKPLNAQTESQLRYVSEQAGVDFIVVSGGQMSKEDAIRAGAVQVGKQWFLNGQPVRTGSIRHDENIGAADVMMRDKRTGQIIDMSTEEGRAKAYEVVKYATQAGMTGFGYGEGYMGSQTMHMGGGHEGSWGAHGSSGSVDWIEQARQEGKQLSPVDSQAWIEQQASQIQPMDQAPVTVPQSPPNAHTTYDANGQVQSDTNLVLPNRGGEKPSEAASKPSTATVFSEDVIKSFPAEPYTDLTVPQTAQPVTPDKPPQLASGGIVPNSAQEPIEVKNKNTGEVLANVNTNERLFTTPAGLQVESAPRIKAEQLLKKNEVPTAVQGEPEQPATPQKKPNTPQFQPSRSSMRQNVTPSRDNLTDIANMDTPVYSPSAHRAFRNATLGSSIGHYNRGTPLEK